MVNEFVVSQHAEEAAFLWTLRNRAVTEPHYSLHDIAALDERVEAQLEGLRVASDVGWSICRSHPATMGPGEVFAISILAFDSGDRDRMREALLAGCASPEVVSGLVSALGWLDFKVVSPWIDRLLKAASPVHRAVGVRASAVQRRDPGSILASAVDDANPVLRNSALRAAGELRRRDLNGLLRTHLTNDEDASRFWSAWSLTLNGQRDGISALTEWFDKGDGSGRRALQLGLRAMNFDESRGWISALAKRSELAANAVMGVGIVGDPAAVPWLIRQMESRELARLAGEAFTMITGLDLAYHDLDQDAPESDSQDQAEAGEVDELDYESNLAWPAPLKIESWWQKNHGAFAHGRRYLGGEVLTPPAAADLLKKGKQRLRQAAAIELALLAPDVPLFEVRGRGSSQERELASWSW
jgi:uncharacterized protein (TIGR02270 family)